MGPPRPPATVPDPDTVSAFAALREKDGALTVMVINKQLERATRATISLANFAPSGTGEVWRLADNQLTRQPDVTYAGGELRADLPAQSIVLFVLRKPVK